MDLQDKNSFKSDSDWYLRAFQLIVEATRNSLPIYQNC